MEIIEDIKGQTGMPDALICQVMKISLSTLGRWRRRKKENHPLLHRPGPKKAEPFDPSALDAEIRLLSHGVKRSAGGNKLYRRYGGSLSRRDLSRMVGQVRQDGVADHRRNLR